MCPLRFFVPMRRKGAKGTEYGQACVPSFPLPKDSLCDTVGTTCLLPFLLHKQKNTVSLLVSIISIWVTETSSPSRQKCRTPTTETSYPLQNSLIFISIYYWYMGEENFPPSAVRTGCFEFISYTVTTQTLQLSANAHATDRSLSGGWDLSGSAHGSAHRAVC